MFSLNFSRLVQDNYTSTPPPLNIDAELPSPQLQNPPPLSVATPMSFVILRHHLAEIIGRIVNHFQQTKKPSLYADALKLDAELMSFMDNLPAHFALNPDTSLDQENPSIPSHRFLLITELYFIRISCKLSASLFNFEKFTVVI